MISKNVDFYINESVQLAVANISGQANVNYGEIEDELYFKTFKTSAIKKTPEKGEPDDTDIFLSREYPEKNSIPFSFELDKVLVLTCSVSFLGHVYSKKRGADGVVPPATYISPPITASARILGIENCFFQEKDEKDINHLFVDQNTKEFKPIRQEERREDNDENKASQKGCALIPVYSYDIDLPIYSSGVQYMKGPVCLSLFRSFVKDSPCFLSTADLETSSCDGAISLKEVEDPPEFFNYAVFGCG